MSIPGTWTFFFCMGTTGAYDQATAKLNADGTVSTEGGTTGRWDSVGGYFLLKGLDNTVFYSGSVQADAMLGMWTNYQDANGSWYAVQEPSDEAKATKVSLKGFLGK